MATIREVVDGLTILAKYDKRGDQSFISADHDIIFAAPSVDLEAVSEEDRASLHKLGWRFNDDNWHHYT